MTADPRPAIADRLLATGSPVHFMVYAGRDLDRALAAPSIHDHLAAHDHDRALFSSKGDLAMLALTYFELREAGYRNVSLSGHTRPGCINVLHTNHLWDDGIEPDRFKVSLVGDFPRRRWAHVQVVQNGDQPGHFMPLWPQPCLRPREGGERFARVGYLGEIDNGNTVWDAARWQAELAPLGLDFTIPPASRWNDMRDLDAVVAIRSFDDRSHGHKPPSKLVNAWLAGVPFIGGADSAYRQIGTPGEDYLLATSPEAVRDALARLRAEPDLRRRLVENGKLRARAYDRDAVLKRWIELLEGPVERRYREWAAHRGRETLRSLVLGNADRVWTRGKAAARAALNGIGR